MKKSFGIWFALLVIVSVFVSCAQAKSSVKGTMTTVDTLSGYSFEAIVLIENMWEGIKIAKDGNGGYILYANMMTNGSSRPGSLILFTDDKRHNLGNPTDWNIDNVSVSRYGTAYYWSMNKVFNNTIINALLNANTVTFRAINGNAYMGQEKAEDVSDVLPKVKAFISK